MEVELAKRGLDLSRRQKKWIYLIAAFGFSTYGVYKVYNLPSVVKKRKRLLKLLGALISVAEVVSDSAETIGVVSRDLKEFLQSDSDQIPTSLKQISKIAKSEEFSESFIGVTQALTAGIIRGYKSETNNEGEEAAQGNSSFSDRFMDKLFSSDGSGFASIIIGNFARSLVMAYYSSGQSSGNSPPENQTSISSLGSDSPIIPKWVNVISSDKCRELIGDSIQLFVSTAVAVYLEKTMDINTYDEIFSGLTNPKHETKVRDVLVSVCNGAIETLVKTSHQVLTSSNSDSNLSSTSSSSGENLSKVIEVGLKQDSSSTGLNQRNPFEGNKDNGWVSKVSSTLAVPSNRRLVLDLTGRITFETVRSFMDFLVWKLLNGLKRSLNVIHEETIERALQVLRYISAKSAVIITICLALCLHLLGGARVLIPA